MELLRAGALDGVTVAVWGGEDVAADCAGAGARVVALEAADEDAAIAAAGALEFDVLVADARAAFDGGGYEAMRAAVDGAFLAARVATTERFAAAGRGRTILVAPAPGAGEHAPATRAALENTARTLSTEWARMQVTVVAVLPGDATSAQELRALVAFLVSDAGAYYAGSALTLGSATASG